MTNKGLTQHPIHGTYKNPWTVHDSTVIQSDLIPAHRIEIATMTTAIKGLDPNRVTRNQGMGKMAVQRINNGRWERIKECSQQRYPAGNINEIKENKIKHYLEVDPSRYIAQGDYRNQILKGSQNENS